MEKPSPFMFQTTSEIIPVANQSENVEQIIDNFNKTEKSGKKQSSFISSEIEESNQLLIAENIFLKEMN
jgi:hypothetical protein